MKHHSLDHMKMYDLPETEARSAPQSALDSQSFAGAWVNTNRLTRGIAEVRISVKDSALFITASCADGDNLNLFGPAPAEAIYAASVDSTVGIAFTADFDLGFMETHMEANLNQGLLVVGSFNSFKDGSGRSDYFSREFFHKK